MWTYPLRTPLVPDTPPRPGPRRAPGRLELATLALGPHVRTIAWLVGLTIITLALATVGILSSVKTGEPVVRSGTIVDVPSSQSIHVEVRLETGDEVLVPRENDDPLAEGDAVTVIETTSALSTVGYRFADADAR